MEKSCIIYTSLDLRGSNMRETKYFERAKTVWKMEARSIERLASKIDPVGFDQMVTTIKRCVQRNGRIFLSGKGVSGAAARKIAHTLCCVDIPASYVSLGDGINASMGLIKKGDLLILFSKGGSTDEVVKLIAPCREKGVQVVGVTSNPASQLALKADEMLRVTVEREVDEKNILATASTMAMMAAFDAIAVAINEID